MVNKFQPRIAGNVKLGRFQDQGNNIVAICRITNSLIDKLNESIETINRLERRIKELEGK